MLSSALASLLICLGRWLISVGTGPPCILLYTKQQMRLFFNLIKSNALLLCRHLNQPNVGGNQVKHKHLGQKRSFNNNKKKVIRDKHAIYKAVKQRHNCCRVQSPFDCVTPSLSFQWKSKQLDLKQDLRDGNRRGVYKKDRLVKVWTGAGPWSRPRLRQEPASSPRLPTGDQPQTTRTAGAQTVPGVERCGETGVI